MVKSDEPELDEYEARQVEAIRKYESEEPGVVSRAVDFVMAPVSWLVQQIIPASTVEGALRGSNWLAERTLDRDAALRVFNVASFDDLKKMSLEKLDDEADAVHNWAVGYAAAEGAGAGWFGIFAAPLDIPFTITLALRTVRRIGHCYGYHGTDELERDFIFAILSEAGANNQTEKLAALTTLRSLQVQLIKQTWKSMAQRATTNRLSRDGALIAIKELAKQLGINLTKRKALAAVPAIGALTGAGVNAVYIGDIAWAARRAYQRRWLVENGRWIEGASS